MKTTSEPIRPVIHEGQPEPEASRPGIDHLRPWEWVQMATSLSRTTVWRLMKEGQFPDPVRISPRRVAWRESDIMSWLKSRQEGRQEGRQHV